MDPHISVVSFNAFHVAPCSIISAIVKDQEKVVVTRGISLQSFGSRLKANRKFL